MNIKQVLDRNKEALLSLDGVVAVGIGYKISEGKKTGEIGIIVSVEKKQPALALNAAEVIPSSLEGFSTDVIQTGKFRKLENTEYMRPAIGGISIGHVDITAGTFGCVVKRNGEKMILSNNHVLANSNEAEIGDSILQPGPYDGGESQHTIATLEDYVPISMSGNDDGGELPDMPSDCPVAGAIVEYANLTAKLLEKKTRLKAVKPNTGKQENSDNLVDAAIARPINPADIDNHIKDIADPTGTADASLDEFLQKSGRTTSYTTDSVLQIAVTVDVQYGEGKVARFVDQIMAGPMSAGGDSGSAVLNKDAEIVGLLFAGSDEFTIINRIQNVFSLLNLTL